MNKKELLLKTLKRIRTAEPISVGSYYTTLDDPLDAWNMDIKTIESYINEIEVK